jgi:hypothetical protein
MSSGVIEVQEILNNKQREIICGALSTDDMNRCLREMSYACIKDLTLVDFNHFRRKNIEDKPENYIFLGYSAVLNNRYIEQLTLSNEFVQAFYHSNDTPTIINIQGLIRMRTLLKLSLYNDEWDRQFFKGLQRYLTNKHCTLQTLELKNVLSDADYDALKMTLKGATSLRHYIGAYQEEFQAILDEK